MSTLPVEENKLNDPEESNGVENEEQKFEEIDLVEITLKNKARVLFRSPVVKNIVSHHSGTILAEDVPKPKLHPSLEEKALNILSTYEISEENGGIDKSLLPEILRKCGYDYGDEVQIKSLCDKLYKGPEFMDNRSFLQFLEVFQAPEYYYGQRLRKNVSRNRIPEVVELLLRNCSINTADGEGLTSLHYAACYNNPKVIEAILKVIPLEKITVNAKDRYGWTPLYCASHHGNFDCVKLLLEMGGDPKSKNLIGKNSLHAALSQNRSLIVDLLIKNATKDNEDVNILNMTDNRGLTPLHDCTYRGHFSLFNSLSANYKKVIDTSIKDDLGYLAIDYEKEFDENAHHHNHEHKTNHK